MKALSYLDRNGKAKLTILGKAVCLSSQATADAFVELEEGKGLAMWIPFDKESGTAKCSACKALGRTDYSYCPSCDACMDQAEYYDRIVKLTEIVKELRKTAEENKKAASQNPSGTILPDKSAELLDDAEFLREEITRCFAAVDQMSRI